MLRNRLRESRNVRSTSVLNEVLSLNAQEYQEHGVLDDKEDLLNEVLSLNAQEYF